ncbi:MAG: SAM-dependent chlorinase/fluorinase [Mariprofundales bacterium]|nr:SAM-dependent chlorinase/fluorinase [Mariprofundales bacterium]
MLILFSDFGTGSPYAGQMEVVCAQAAPDVSRVVLTHDAPLADPRAAGVLLAGLISTMPERAVFLCVVDPGVGMDRRPLIVQQGKRWFVGPDNGLLVEAAGANAAWFQIDWRPQHLSATFHGRDLFAPVAAGLAQGRMPAVTPIDDPVGLAVEPCLDRVIFIDRFGNLISGIQASAVDAATDVAVAGHTIAHGRCFGEAAPGSLFWYANSMGLVAVAGNGVSAAELLGVTLGATMQMTKGMD